MKKWIEVINDREEAIKSKMEEMYQRAASITTGPFKLHYGLKLNQDGELAIDCHTDSSSVCGSVWEGKAIYIAGIQEFSVLEGEENWQEAMENLLGIETLEAYRQWCISIKYLEEVKYSLDLLQEFCPEIYAQFCQEYLNCFIEDELQNWIEEQYQRKIEQLQEYLDI